VRRCVGCGAREARSDLLRVVAESGPGAGDHPRRAVPDPDRVLPGRGANLHPDPVCLDRAERRRALPRALRVPGPLDVTAVREHVEQVQRQRPEHGPETEAGPNR
jgi:predicted RNA-binding protein YlxR (DUF448 family)